METEGYKIVGRAKTVLVRGTDDQQAGVISSIIVRMVEPVGSQLSFSGQVSFSIQARDHIETMLLPIVDRITKALGLASKGYEISAVNIAAASMNETGVGISGFSADVPIFITMLSAALQIPVPQHILATGHIASITGDITAVRAIPAKLQAAMADDSINTFLYPADCSRVDENCQAIVTARDDIKVRMVEHISEVLEIVFEQEDIILAALKEEFFAVSGETDHTDEPICQIVEMFGRHNEDRFWSVLRNHLLGGKIQKVRRLLRSFTDYYIGQKCYPSHFGSKLLSFVFATPPAVRKPNNCFPLMDTGHCIELSRFAKDSDYDDVPKLLDAVGGRNIFPSHGTAIPINQVDEQNNPDGLFDQVISELNEKAFAKKYGILIDSARGSFVLKSVTVESYQEFIDTIVSFYIHLRCYISQSPVESINPDTFRNEAIDLLQTTYRKEGIETAFQRASDGISGGMRILLDRLTEEYKKQQQSKYINRIFTDALDSLRWTDRVDFMRLAMKRLKNFLPAEIVNEPPERFARDYEQIVKAYIESMDQFNRTISKY